MSIPSRCRATTSWPRAAAPFLVCHFLSGWWGQGCAIVQRRFDLNISSTNKEPVPGEYVVVINRGRQSEANVTVTEALVGAGEVEFGGDPVPIGTYLAMSDSDFGCAS